MEAQSSFKNDVAIWTPGVLLSSFFSPKDMALMTFLSPSPEKHVQQFPSRDFQMSKGFDGQSVLHEPISEYIS